MHPQTSLSLRGTKCQSNLEEREKLLLEIATPFHRRACNDRKGKLEMIKECLHSLIKEMMIDMHKYLVIFKKAGDNYSAYSPDIPGCIVTGTTRDEVEKNIREAISFHIEGMVENGLPIPEPDSFTEYVEV